MPQKDVECFRMLLDHLAWIDRPFLSGIGDSRKAESLWGMMGCVGGVRWLIHQSWLAKGLGLGLLCWGFKGVQGEKFRRKRPALFKCNDLLTYIADKIFKQAWDYLYTGKQFKQFQIEHSINY